MGWCVFKRYQFAGEDRPCLVLGSAPEPTLPENLRKKTTLVCVNGSGWSAKQAGWGSPSLTVMLGSLLTADHTVRDREALRGLDTDTLTLIHSWPRGRSLSEIQTKRRLKELGYSCNRLVAISKRKRNKVLRRMIGHRIDGPGSDDRPSNGVLAACLALWRGSPEVVLAGFSLRQDGHSYDSQSVRKRHHRAADREAIASLLTRGFSVSATEPELASALGLKLIR